MDFTREPIIETVITPREGCTLVIRSSKGSGQEEYFVDALEVVIFGNAIFFRSRERPKAFLVPATDYEVLEVRETRLVLKNVGLDRSIKIAGGREASLRTAREPSARVESGESVVDKSAAHVSEGEVGRPLVPPSLSPTTDSKPESRIDKKRDRRRNYRRRRGRDDEGKIETEESHVNVPEGASIELPPPELSREEITATAASAPVAAVLSSLLAPPPNLISETIARYKDNALFKGAFFLKDEGEDFEDEGDSEDADDEIGDDEFPSTDSSDEETDRRFSEHHDLESHKHEDIQVELPSMSLDFPVYAPHEHLIQEQLEAPTEQGRCDEKPSEYPGDTDPEESVREAPVGEPVSEGPPLLEDPENDSTVDKTMHNAGFSDKDMHREDS